MAAFDHFSLCVTDLDQSIAFYTDILGLELVSRREDGGQTVFQVGDSLLVLFCGEDYQSVDRGTRRGMHHVAFCLDNAAYDGVLARLEETGAAFRGPTLNKGAQGQGLATYFHDPDGNEVEIKKYE